MRGSLVIERGLFDAIIFYGRGDAPDITFVLSLGPSGVKRVHSSVPGYSKGFPWCLETSVSRTSTRLIVVVFPVCMSTLGTGFSFIVKSDGFSSVPEFKKEKYRYDLVTDIFALEVICSMWDHIIHGYHISS